MFCAKVIALRYLYKLHKLLNYVHMFTKRPEDK